MTRDNYELYLILKERCAETAHNYLVKCRERDRLANTGRKSPPTIIGDRYDSWIEKTVYPYEFTAEDIEEFVEYHWMNAVYSMYDCTGCTFTSDIKCFPINGKTIVYHFKALDV